VTSVRSVGTLVALALALGACSSSGSSPVATKSGSPSSRASHSASSSKASPHSTPRPSSPLHVRASYASVRLPSPLSRAVVLNRGGSLVVAGGENAAGSSATILLFDPATGRITTTGQLVTAGHDAAGAVLPSGELVLGGGVTTSVTTVQRLATTGRASVVGQLPRPRSDLVAGTVGNAVYVLGGYDGSVWQADILRTSDGQHFARVGTLPVPVRYPAIAVDGTTIYLFGGDRQNGPTDVVQAVDTRSGRARVVAHLPLALGHATALNLDGTLLIAGGRTNHQATRTIWSFAPGSQHFAVVGRLPLAMSDAGVGVVGSVGYLVGGEAQSALSRVVEVRLA
jgi:hypothetical protein